MDLKQWMEAVHETAKQNGWWDGERPVPELLCLVHSEVSEALEAYRKQDEVNFNEELADIVIRVFDLAQHFNIDLEKEIMDKDTYNRTRGYRHGGKLC